MDYFKIFSRLGFVLLREIFKGNIIANFKKIIVNINNSYYLYIICKVFIYVLGIVVSVLYALVY